MAYPLSLIHKVKQQQETRIMTNSREIKKALTKAFKGVKFKVTTRNVLCETITVEWTGHPFVNQVKTITDAWNTYQDHSDAMTDYFHHTGTEIKFERRLSQEEIDFVVPGILRLEGKSVDGVHIELKVNDYSEYFVGNEDGRYNYHVNCRDHNKALENYHLNGMAVELDSYEAEHAKDDYLYSTNKDAWLAKVEQEKQQKQAEYEAKQAEIEATLIQGDYTGTPANDNLDYIVIHWHEGVQTIKEGAKFSSFKSANDAIRKIFDQEGMEWSDDQGYEKLKFSIHFADGEVYADGRLDLSPREDNPFATDNVIGKHCVDFLKWQVENSDCQEAREYLEKYSFDDSTKSGSDLKAVASEWLIEDDAKFNNLVVGSGYTSQELHATISKVANDRLEAAIPGSDILEAKYAEWVQKKLAQGQAGKIVSFDDWLDIHNS